MILYSSFLFTTMQGEVGLPKFQLKEKSTYLDSTESRSPVLYF